MYDGLTGRYTFSCPAGGRPVRLSAFRSLERLPGAAHPAVYRVVFACPCGESTPGLVTHDELDWAPLGASGRAFFNLMTARSRVRGGRARDLAARRIRLGRLALELLLLPGGPASARLPSAFLVLSPAAGARGRRSAAPSAVHAVNLVSRAHVDLPFYNDRRSRWSTRLRTRSRRLSHCLPGRARFSRVRRATARSGRLALVRDRE